MNFDSGISNSPRRERVSEEAVKFKLKGLGLDINDEGKVTGIDLAEKKDESAIAWKRYEEPVKPDRRLGRFTIHEKMISTPEIKELLAQMQFVPLEVSFKYDLRGYSMMGISPAFEEMSEGVKAPLYILNIEAKGKKVNYWFSKA